MSENEQNPIVPQVLGFLAMKIKSDDSTPLQMTAWKIVRYEVTPPLDNILRVAKLRLGTKKK